MRKRMGSICIMIALAIFTSLGPVSAARQSVTSPESVQLSDEDRSFIIKAAHSGMAEVELGRIAVERATSQEVKQFAQKMIDDHTRANDELMQLATSKGVTLPKPVTTTEPATVPQTPPDARPQTEKQQQEPPPPPPPSPTQDEKTGSTDEMDMHKKHQAVKDHLSGLSGAEFDRAYMQHMVEDHTEAVTLFQNTATNGKDAEVKAWAAKTLPALQEHLRLAQEISGRINAEPSKPDTASSAQPKTKPNNQ